MNKKCNSANYKNTVFEAYMLYIYEINTHLYLTGPQGFDELIQLAADIVDARLASGSSRTFLAFTQTLLQFAEGLQELIDRNGHISGGNL